MITTLVYWRKNSINYFPVPTEEVERIIKRLRKEGWGCEIYSEELIKKIIEKVW
jgi:hypothetical protein